MKRLNISSRVERLEANQGRMHAVPVPDTVIDDLALGAQRRVIVEIGGVEINRAILAPKSGQPYLIIGKSHLNEVGLKEGSPVEMTLRADPNPEAVDLAEALREALAQDPEARERWETFTPGMKRSLNLYIDSAKRPETRARRAVEMAEKIRTRTFHGDG